MVKVASFTRYDVKTDSMIQPAYKMLVQALRPQDGYVKIADTEEDVPIESLDEDGRYHPSKARGAHSRTSRLHRLWRPGIDRKQT